ncbi:MAG: response regulator [Hungateiclostridium thermocellum]|nr:response regulator [Acetivibrio thermocellus]
MLKVLIVDDDAYARNDLKNIMNWEKNGFKLLGEASDGYTAIDMIKKDTPDIIITDINMPILNGIALIDYVRANFPHVKIIALSGYDDFDYVRHSMIKGAKDYLLKDRLNETVLLNTLKSAVEDTHELEEKSKEEHIQHQLLTGRQMLKRNFIRRLITGGFSDINSISHEASGLKLNLELKNNIMIIMEIDNYSFLEEIHSSEELDSFIKTILDITNEILLMEWGKAERFYLGDARFLLVFSVDTSLGYYNTYTRLIEIINKIRKGIKNFLNLTACFSISRLCPSIMEFDRYYKEAEKVLQDKFYRGKDKIFTVDSVGEIKNVFITLTIEDEKNINVYLQSRNYEQISGYLSKIFDNLVKQKANHKSVQMICVELISIVNKTAKLYGLKTSDIYLNDENPYDKIKKYDNIMDIKEWLTGIYKKLISLMNAYGIDNNYSEYTKKVIEFVNKNYKKDISLSDAAEHIGVSSSYLSKIFKEDYGKGFVEFLNMIRIQNAKTLLENGMISLKDIAYEVGFNNYHYFFRVFKNIVGVTPEKYRKDINRSAGN